MDLPPPPGYSSFGSPGYYSLEKGHFVYDPNHRSPFSFGIAPHDNPDFFGYQAAPQFDETEIPPPFAAPSDEDEAKYAPRAAEEDKRSKHCYVLDDYLDGHDTFFFHQGKDINRLRLLPMKGGLRVNTEIVRNNEKTQITHSLVSTAFDAQQKALKASNPYRTVYFTLWKNGTIAWSGEAIGPKNLVGNLVNVERDSERLGKMLAKLGKAK